MSKINRWTDSETDRHICPLYQIIFNDQIILNILNNTEIPSTAAEYANELVSVITNQSNIHDDQKNFTQLMKSVLYHRCLISMPSLLMY